MKRFRLYFFYLIPVAAGLLLSVLLKADQYVFDPLSDISDHNTYGFPTPTAIRLLTGNSYEAVTDGFLSKPSYKHVKPRYYVLRTDSDVEANAVHLQALTDEALVRLNDEADEQLRVQYQMLNETLRPLLDSDMTAEHVSYLYLGDPDVLSIPVFYYPQKKLVVYVMEFIRCNGSLRRWLRNKDDRTCY